MAESSTALSWTKNNGDIVGVAYVRRRVSSHLGNRWRTIYSSEARNAAIKATLGSESWLKFRNGQTVSAVVRDVENALLETQRPSGMAPRR